MRTRKSAGPKSAFLDFPYPIPDVAADCGCCERDIALWSLRRRLTGIPPQIGQSDRLVLCHLKPERVLSTPVRRRDLSDNDRAQMRPWNKQEPGTTHRSPDPQPNPAGSHLDHGVRLRIRTPMSRSGFLFVPW